MNNLDKELGVIEKGLKITEKDLDINPVSGRHEVIVQQDMGDVNDAQADYEYQREQFYKLVDRGSVAIDGILELAKEGEHPRAYEVAGQLIKNVAEVTEKLGDLQKKMKELKEVPETGPKNVTNALFVGSTAELQKMIKGK
jgi:Terminase DNA packaging enzyme.